MALQREVEPYSDNRHPDRRVHHSWGTPAEYEADLDRVIEKGQAGTA
jgi:hypothetical protein